VNFGEVDTSVDEVVGKLDIPELCVVKSKDSFLNFSID
jgi:hypothetical protein